MLLREVAAAKEQAEKLEAEAQARADEAAAQAMGAATDKQRNLCKKIFTRMIQGKTRVFWQHWDMQTFGKKRMQAVMKKVLKRLLKGPAPQGLPAVEVRPRRSGTSSRRSLLKTD